MTRLIALGLLPERGGQPVKAWVNVSLGDLMLLEGSSALLGEWTDRLRARWAAHRAAACGGSGSGDNGARSREALEQAIVGKAAALLSGPGGLASFLMGT